MTIAQLIVLSNGKKEVYDLEANCYIVGRKASVCDIVIDDRFVSSIHMNLIKMHVDDKLIPRLHYQILNGEKAGKPSRNGIIVNGVSIDNKYSLRHGDTIRLSPTTTLLYQETKFLKRVPSSQGVTYETYPLTA